MAQKPLKKIKVHKKEKTKVRKKKASKKLNNRQFMTREINKKILELAEGKRDFNSK